MDLITSSDPHPQPVEDRIVIFTKEDGEIYGMTEDGAEFLLSHLSIDVEIVDEDTILLKHHPIGAMQGVYKRVRDN